MMTHLYRRGNPAQPNPSNLPSHVQNRIDTTFSRLKAKGQAAFIPYVSAGDPTLTATRRLILTLEENGADVVELGVPFSDPLADGIVNQKAAQRALAAGATVRGVLDLVRDVRTESGIPIVLFTYLNPVYAYGFDLFQRDAAAAGVDGVLILDLPPDEASQNAELAEAGEIRHIRLIAPTTPADRVGEIARQSEGFIYYVSREGVTGAQTALSDSIGARVQAIGRATETPVAVGFGISTPEQAAEVAAAADGVVVGSAIVRKIEEFGDSPRLTQEVADFVRPIAEAIKNAR